MAAAMRRALSLRDCCRHVEADKQLGHRAAALETKPERTFLISALQKQHTKELTYALQQLVDEVKAAEKDEATNQADNFVWTEGEQNVRDPVNGAKVGAEDELDDFFDDDDLGVEIVYQK